MAFVDEYDEYDRRVPTIQSKKTLSVYTKIVMNDILADEPFYEEAGPRRARSHDRGKRPSISNLDIISENHTSKCILSIPSSTFFI